MGQKSSLYRTVEILKMLNEGKQLCISNVACAYDVSERTIRRDFELIRELFGDFITKEGKCFQAYEKFLLQDVLNATDLMTLANIINLFGMVCVESSISSKTKALIDESMSVYDFKSRPFENMQNTQVVKELEHAIKFTKQIKVIYQTERNTSKKIFDPYKILFINENFYLVGENSSKGVFEFLRISLISKVEFTKKSFYPQKDIQKFITQIQTPWAAYPKERVQTIDVRLRANTHIRRFFKFKKYLPSQEIHSTFENGDIEVGYRVTNLREIEELVIKWLPHISIISPRNALNKMIKKRLKEKLNALK
jgi:predicted DNA-binding transcriptional regulator YafY